jgi:hypothetical protein
MIVYSATEYVGKEQQETQLLNEHIKDLQEQNTRYANRAAAYELAHEIIKRYPTSSYRLLALIHDLVFNKLYLAEDVTEMLIKATVDPT